MIPCSCLDFGLIPSTIMWWLRAGSSCSEYGLDPVATTTSNGQERSGESQMQLGQHMSDEQKARCSAAQMGHFVSLATRAKMAARMTGQPAWNRGIPMTDEQKAQSSLAHMGQVASPEARVHMSAAGMGNKNCVGRVPWNKGTPLTAEHRAALSANHADMKRERNPFWKGGVTPENLIIRGSLAYVAWRNAVFERDNYTCQECGAHSGNGHAVVLEAHHVHEFARYPDERFVVDNGKTLCQKCHNKTKGWCRTIEVTP